MKNSIFALALASFIPGTVMAESRSLKATNGTAIEVSYTKSDFTVVGESYGTAIRDLAFRLSNYGGSSLSVLTVKCGGIGSSSYEYSVSCGAEPSGWMPVNYDCTLNAADAYTRNYFRRSYAELVSSVRSRNGSALNCKFELSVVRDGQWLTDPVNGTHNFELAL